MNLEKEVLLEVQNVSKKFSRNLKRSLWYGLIDIFNSLLGRVGSKNILRKDEFWVLKDINFQIRRGECVALIGHNGAGKSTLLKVLNGLIQPEQGKVIIRGKVGALIELGAGFNPILTGRENIYINGQILGFSKKEIDNKLKSILDFAEIGKFIDSPVQNYSSGMKVRLGFAIAAQMEPDILIIDEVMAVGDISFQGKCYNKLFSSINRTAIIIVSHSMPQVSRICNRGILLNNGLLLVDNQIQDVVKEYYNIMPQEKGNLFIAEKNSFNFLKINEQLCDSGNPVEVSYSSKIDVLLNFTTFHDTVNLKIHFVNRDLQIVASVKFDRIKLSKKSSCTEISLKGIGPILFSPGLYKISISITEYRNNVPIIYYNAFWGLKVLGSNIQDLPSSILLNGELNENQ